jgi:uncharacterized protein YqhQ
MLISLYNYFEEESQDKKQEEKSGEKGETDSNDQTSEIKFILGLLMLNFVFISVPGLILQFTSMMPFNDVCQTNQTN